MGYTALTFTAGEVPTVATWNLLPANDASFNNGTGIADLTIGTTTNLTNPYKFSVIGTGTQTLTSAGTYYTVQFNSKVFDTNSNYSLTTYQFTAPVAGFYQFNVLVSFSPGSANYCNAQLQHNGSGITLWQGDATAQQTNPGVGGSKLVQLASGDTISITGASQQNSCLLALANCLFEGFLVSNT